MNFTKQFILRNLLKLRDHHGEIDIEAVDNLVDAFRDELREKFDSDPQFDSYEETRREVKFEERAREMILSITNVY
jgi:hypothetical protein